LHKQKTGFRRTHEDSIVAVSCRPIVLIGVSMLALSSCNQNPPTPEAHQEASLNLVSEQTVFRKGEPFKVRLEVFSPEDSLVNISLGASKNLGLAQDNLQITVAAGQTQTLELSGTPKRSGYYNITANATGSQWHEPAADMLGFNVATTDLAAANAGAYPQSTTGLESLLWYIGHVAFSFAGAWDARIRPATLPSTYLEATKAIANDTYFSSLSGLPTP
jgi:hypothetical protein